MIPSIKQLWSTFHKVSKAKQPPKPKPKPQQKELPDYFQQAKSWADDYYTSMVASRNRYRVAFFSAMGLSILLALSVATLVPTQRLIPMAVTQFADGDVTVTPLTNPHPPMNQAQTESDIVRYLVNRESFSADSYDVQYRLVMLLSSEHVANEYAHEQSVSNPASPINTLGRKATKLVHVESILFLDKADLPHQPGEKAPHSNLAQVNFTVTIRQRASGQHKTIPLTALVSWAYQGIPNDPDKLWQNWDGFHITRYQLQQRSVKTLKGALS